MIAPCPEDQIQRLTRRKAAPLVPFLALLEQDIETRPHALVPLTQDFAARISAATEGVTVYSNDPIEGEVAL